jgi:hypothetical protein
MSELELASMACRLLKAAQDNWERGAIDYPEYADRVDDITSKLICDLLDIGTRRKGSSNGLPLLQ